MIERIGIFILKDKLTNIYNDDKTLVIFDMRYNRVVGVETISFKKDFVSLEDFLIYLQRKYINLVYVSTMDIETKEKFKNYGIEVKTASTLDDDKLLNTLYLSPPFS